MKDIDREPFAKVDVKRYVYSVKIANIQILSVNGQDGRTSPLIARMRVDELADAVNAAFNKRLDEEIAKVVWVQEEAK